MKKYRLPFLVLIAAVLSIAAVENRLKDKNEAVTWAVDDWLYLDGATNGVRKLAPTRFDVAGAATAAQAAAIAASQPLNTKLTNFGALANTVGYFHNDGAGGYAWIVPGGSYTVPSGTGFQHISGGSQDGVAQLVTNGDIVDGTILNAKLANMVTGTVKMRHSGTTGPAEDTTLANLKNDLALNNVANVDTTIASNISSGTLPAARLPAPTASTFGGVQSSAAVANQWIRSIGTDGIPTKSQPAFTDVSGQNTDAQLPGTFGSHTYGGLMTLSDGLVNAGSTVAGVTNTYTLPAGNRRNKISFSAAPTLALSGTWTTDGVRSELTAVSTSGSTLLVTLPAGTWYDTNAARVITSYWHGANATETLTITYDAANTRYLIDGVPQPSTTAEFAQTAASTTDLWQSSLNQTITGVTPITSFGSNAPTGTHVFLRFLAATPITYNSTSMILPGSANITAAIGDTAEAFALGSGNWQIARYTKRDGTSIVGSGSSTFTPNAQTVGYTLGSTDLTNINANASLTTLVSISNASANNLTVPLNSVTAFPIGSCVLVQQLGVGATTIVATGGVTINTPSSLVIGSQYAIVPLIKTGTDTWQLGATSIPSGFTYTNPIISGTITFGSGLSQHFYNNFSTTSQAPTAATRTYIAGSGLSITAGQIQVGTVFRWRVNMTKTAAGTASSTFDVAFGTAGTTADTAQVSFTKPAGTAAVDEGWVDIECIVRTNSATGVVVGEFRMVHNLAATGHAVIPCVVVNTVSSTFNTTTPTKIGLCITTGASDAITIQQCTAEAVNL